MHKMKSRSTSLFVKTKHHVNKSAYKDIQSTLYMDLPITSSKNHVFYRNEMLKSTNSLTCNEKECLHYQLKPIIMLLRVFGAFPVHIGSSGVPSFKWLSPIMAYSVLLIILMNIFSFISIRDLYTKILRDKSFCDSLYNIIYITILISTLWIPLLSWIDMKKSINYIKKWMEFQKMFLNITGNHLDLRLRKRSTVLLGLSFASFIAVGVKYQTTSDLEVWQLPPYLFAAIATSNIASLRNLLFIALKRTHIQLCKSFKKTPVTAEMIREYKILWLHWSHLVSQKDYMLGTMFGFSILVMLFIVIISLYTSLVGLQTQDTNWVHLISTVSPCIISSLSLYSICNNGHELRILGTEIKEKLQLISSFYVSQQVIKEVKSFLTVIATNTPVVSAIGFVDIDRELFRALMSTTVTYMIVLLQFDRDSSCSDT